MTRATVALAGLLFGSVVGAQEAKRSSYPSFDYEVARTHEIKPHRRIIPMQGEDRGFDQLRLTLVVSPVGNVTDSEASGDASSMRFWQQLQREVSQWKFTPFKQYGKAVTAEVEEYVDLVPPEQLPINRVEPPILKRDSQVTITLRRSTCLGTCPSYVVTVSTEGVIFKGEQFVSSKGRHVGEVKPEEVRKLARRFVDADFYSMEDRYTAIVTDHPTNVLSISIDGKTKKVVDYVGFRVGMPAVISELEDEVDTLARTQRWVLGKGGALKR